MLNILRSIQWFIWRCWPNIPCSISICHRDCKHHWIYWGYSPSDKVAFTADWTSCRAFSFSVPYSKLAAFGITWSIGSNSRPKGDKCCLYNLRNPIKHGGFFSVIRRQKVAISLRRHILTCPRPLTPWKNHQCDFWWYKPQNLERFVSHKFWNSFYFLSTWLGHHMIASGKQTNAMFYRTERWSSFLLTRRWHRFRRLMYIAGPNTWK